MVVLPTPPFGANTETTRVAATSSRAANSLRDAGDAVHQVEPGERHRQDARGRPSSGSTSTGFWGTVSMMTGTLEPDFRDLLGELRTLDPALQEGVDEHDVRPQLADLGDAPCCRR